MANHTFLWHDYETFGADVRQARPSQFAAIRTDAALNEIGEPLMLYCQPANDFLPEPEACLITGITPQICLERGVPEHEFAARIEQAFAQPDTIGVGYNSIRFDDEITRFMLWRNLMDPYAREWQNGCGRWDLLDVMRTAHALRPDGINWPTKEDGSPSFKLTALSAANQLVHESAHDALSDVRATIALARLLRDKQPRLFDFCLSLHKKDRVAQELGLPTTAATAKPFLHISGMFASAHGCMAIMWPLATHPTNRNELLAWNLAYDPSELLSLDVPTLRQRLFTRAAELPPGVQRLPVKSVHLNKSPMVISNMRTLSDAMAERWGLDRDMAQRHADVAATLPDMSAIWAEVMRREPQSAPDVDQDLYGGFINNADRRRLNDLRGLAPAALARARASFDDARLHELLFRYRARNFAETLSDEENERWQAHRTARFLEGEGGALSVDGLFAKLDELSATADEKAEAILSALYEYAESVVPEQ